jgi:hypothetical protein
MKKLTWKKKKYDDLTLWMAEIKSIGWQFSIEQIAKNKYQAYIYYGHGEDCPILPSGVIFNSLKEAQKVCNDWLHNIIINLNKWI